MVHRAYIYTIICLKSVVVRTLQVTILARSPREMSLTDRILPRYILSRVRVSVRPRIFLYAKNPKICLKSAGVRKLQVAILERSPREMSQTDRILPRYILSRVRVSVRPRIFLYTKKPQTRVAVYFDPLCGQINN